MSDEFDNKPVAYDENTGAGNNAEPPIESTVVQNQKKSLSKRIAGALMSEDYKILFDSIYQNIIGPALRRVIVEAFSAFVYRGKGRGYDSFDEPHNYQSYYDDRERGGSEDRLRRNFGEIQFKNIDSAERVLGRMRSKLKTERVVLVSDFYKYAGQTPKHTYYDWGWTDLSQASIYHYNVKGERVWSIHLPEPMYIDHTR